MFYKNARILIAVYGAVQVGGVQNKNDNCQIYEDNKKLEKYKHSLSNIKRFVMYWVPKTKQNILFKRDILQEVQSAEREDKQC